MLKLGKILLTVAWGALGVFVVPPIVVWIIFFIVTLLSPNPPKPKVKYGEFPFKIEYEINGEKKLIKDSVICEFDGIEWNESRGKFRKWKWHLKSGNSTDLVIFSKINSTFHIYYYVGSPEYYMGDVNKNEQYALYSPGFWNNGDGRYLDNRDLTKYGIKLINWEYSSPIVNKFNMKFT